MGKNYVKLLNMIAFGHTAFGAIIGAASFEAIGKTDPVLGLVAAAGISIAAHYAEDFIPHGHFFPVKEYGKKIIYVIIFDLGLSIALFAGKSFIDFGFGLKFLYILTGIIGSQLPDALEGLTNIGLLPKKGFIRGENKLNELVHWHGTGSKALLLGTRDLWQLAVIFIAFFFI